MPAPPIHGSSSYVPASFIRSALGDALSRIRQEERLTWADVGEAIGKSEDQAAKYADGTAEMGVVAFYRAKAVWNGRFTSAADDLVEAAAEKISAQKAQSCILEAALGLAKALENGELSVAEIRANRSTLETSRDAISALLDRLTPQEVRK
jgi:hypothetical protein